MPFSTDRSEKSIIKDVVGISSTVCNLVPCCAATIALMFLTILTIVVKPVTPEIKGLVHDECFRVDRYDM